MKRTKFSELTRWKIVSIRFSDSFKCKFGCAKKKESFSILTNIGNNLNINDSFIVKYLFAFKHTHTPERMQI